MAYPQSKGRSGDKSMPGNQRPGPGVWDGALGGTRVIWRKLDCLNPNLQKMEVHIRRKDT